MVYTCTVLGSRGMTLNTAVHKISVSIATVVRPRLTQVDDHVVCHIHVALHVCEGEHKVTDTPYVRKERLLSQTCCRMSHVL